MKYPFIYFFALFAFFGFHPAFGSCHQNSAANLPVTRFLLKDGEAYDKETKLTWSRCSVGANWKPGAGCVGQIKLMSLDKAKDVARLKSGWRIPTIKELHSIVENGCTEPAINSAVFPDVNDFNDGAPYWSITSTKEIPSLYYYVDFMKGEVDAHSNGFSMAVRLVRDGQ